MLGKFVKVHYGQQDQCLPERLARFFVAQLVTVVGNLHRSGIVHRDLQMSNLMIDRKGSLKLIDFAMSQKESMTQADASLRHLKNPEYMAPEIIE